MSLLSRLSRIALQMLTFIGESAIGTGHGEMYVLVSGLETGRDSLMEEESLQVVLDLRGHQSRTPRSPPHNDPLGIVRSSWEIEAWRRCRGRAG